MPKYTIYVYIEVNKFLVYVCLCNEGVEEKIEGDANRHYPPRNRVKRSLEKGSLYVLYLKFTMGNCILFFICMCNILYVLYCMCNRCHTLSYLSYLVANTAVHSNNCCTMWMICSATYKLAYALRDMFATHFQQMDRLCWIYLLNMYCCFIYRLNEEAVLKILLSLHYVVTCPSQKIIA